nr:hypothetical protein [Morchella crassipes]
MRRKRRAGRREGGQLTLRGGLPAFFASRGAAEQVLSYIYVYIYIIKPNYHPHSVPLCGWGEGRGGRKWSHPPRSVPWVTPPPAYEVGWGLPMRCIPPPCIWAPPPPHFALLGAGFIIYICLYI